MNDFRYNPEEAKYKPEDSGAPTGLTKKVPHSSDKKVKRAKKKGVASKAADGGSENEKGAAANLAKAAATVATSSANIENENPNNKEKSGLFKMSNRKKKKSSTDNSSPEKREERKVTIEAACPNQNDCSIEMDELEETKKGS